jgi:putative membrane protein
MNFAIKLPALPDKPGSASRNLLGGFMSRITRGLALLGACTLWAACSKNDNGSAGATTGADTSAATAAAVPAPAAPALNDTTILGTLDAVNAADSSAGSVAAKKGTNAQVKSFANRMMRDHHKLRADGQALAKKINITPSLPPGDMLQQSASAWLDSLNALPKGAAFDSAYINHEVAAHQAVVQILQNAQGAAQDSSLKAAITQAIPLIQAHLTQAQSVQSKVSGSTASGSDTAKTP